MSQEKIVINVTGEHAVVTINQYESPLAAFAADLISTEPKKDDESAVGIMPFGSTGGPGRG